jgi:asparagine synthase (glutamine-hydrolysing)
MCGIAGFFRPGLCAEGAAREAAAMGRALRHRGPDDAGVWLDAEGGIVLAHQRLAIVDLSPAGHQPMVSASGRFVVAFNGEIYNHRALRQALGGGAPAWRGASDTETLLAAVERWGVGEALNRSVGMFALALWDREARTLTLARDRFGEKPLYYGWTGQDTFAFASELKAFRALPGFANPVARSALMQYLRFQYVPAPRSIFEGVFKLEPGCLLIVREAPPREAPPHPLRPGEVHGPVAVHPWWDPGEALQRARQAPLLDATQAVEALSDGLEEAVRLQALADVPLGAFLSGGVDSSTIVALMQAHATRVGGDPVQTFTIGFDEPGFDEAPHARAVARHLGTRHHELRVTAAEAQGVIPLLSAMYDEPFADSSQIPTHLVCRAARAHVTVALSGDGGDELFGGYNRYFWGPRVWEKVSWLPFPLRRTLGAAVAAVPVTAWDALGQMTGVHRAGDKAHRLAARLAAVRSLDDLYRSLVSEWPDPAALVVGGGAPGPSLLDDPLPPALAAAADPRERMMWWDSRTYLPDDILCKVDRAAMAVSLETRTPFLDHRVAEVAARMAMTHRIRGGVGKWALRQVLYRHVPPALIERPKAGFGIPVGQWLRGPLRGWAGDLLTEEALRRHGDLQPAPVVRAWQEHLSGRRDWTARLWSVLMFQAWRQDTATTSSPPPER